MSKLDYAVKGQKLRCLENYNYSSLLTVGKVYEAIEDAKHGRFWSNENLVPVTCDDGQVRRVFVHRFEGVMPIDPVIDALKAVGVGAQNATVAFAKLADAISTNKPNKNKMKTQSLIRDNKGKFKSTKPTALRAGSLYRVVGPTPVIGRLRSFTFDNQAVLSVHSQPVVVKTAAIRLADEQDVNSYLASTPDKVKRKIQTGAFLPK